MKKKLLPALLALAMALSLLPLAAFAVDAGSSGTTPVAKVGETEYETIAAAFVAHVKAGATVTIDVIASTEADIVIPANTNVTLNIAEGVVLKNSSDNTITNNGTLTVTGKGTVDNKSHQKAAILNKGVAYLNGCTFSRSQEKGTWDPYKDNGNSWYTIRNEGAMTIDGATVIQGGTAENPTGGFSSLVQNLGSDSGRATLTIKRGRFSGGVNTVKNDAKADLTIEDGTFTNTSQHVIMNWDKAAIEGGTFTCVAGSAEASAAVMNVKNDATGSVGQLTITGGTFVGKPNSSPVKTNSSYKSDPVISGGAYSAAIDISFLAEGYEYQAETKTSTNASDPTGENTTSLFTYHKDVASARAEAAKGNVPGEVKVASQGEDGSSSFVAAKYIIATTQPASGGSFTINSGKTFDNVEANSVVTIALTVASGYELNAITVTAADGTIVSTVGGGTSYQFFMPQSDVTVAVTYKTAALNPADGYEYVSYAPADEGYAQWMSGKLTLKSLQNSKYYLVQLMDASGAVGVYQVRQADSSGKIEMIAQTGAKLLVWYIGDDATNVAGALQNDPILGGRDGISLAG